MQEEQHQIFVGTREDIVRTHGDQSLSILAQIDLF